MILDETARTLFVVFENYERCVAVSEEGPDEVFADDALLTEQGIERIVAFQILDIDNFNPVDLDRYDYKLSKEQKNLVKREYLKTLSSS